MGMANSLETNEKLPIKVLIVDDHPVVRNGIKLALSNQPDIQVAGEAADGVEAEALALKLCPEVIVMDLYMPNRNGLEAMLGIKRKLPDTKFLFLTVSEEHEDLVRAVRFGADGYLLKRSDVDDIAKAVRTVAAGECILSPAMTKRVLKELSGGKREPTLSKREQEVLDLVALGMSNSEIAASLFVAQNTVSTYIYRLLQKLHLKNKAEAIAYSLHRKRRADPI